MELRCVNYFELMQTLKFDDVYIVFRCFGVFNIPVSFYHKTQTKHYECKSNRRLKFTLHWHLLNPSEHKHLRATELTPARRVTIEVEESQKIGRNSNSQLEKVHQNGKMHFFKKDDYAWKGSTRTLMKMKVV